MAYDESYILNKVNMYNIDNVEEDDILSLINSIKAEVAHRCPIYCWATLTLVANTYSYDIPTVSITNRTITNGRIVDIYWNPNFSAVYPGGLYSVYDYTDKAIENAIGYRSGKGSYDIIEGRITLYPTPAANGSIIALMSTDRLDSEMDMDMNDIISDGTLAMVFTRLSVNMAQGGSWSAGRYSVANSDHMLRLSGMAFYFSDRYINGFGLAQIEVR
jgi:hypothetical protein